MNRIKPQILLVQLFSNGDCLFATAVARQIKHDHPSCELTWAIAGSCRHIIAHNPYVDHVLEVNEVAKDDVASFRRFRKKIMQQKSAGVWDEVFITHNMDKNLAFYDGTIRGMILRAYPKKMTVPLQPVLQLTDDEKGRVEAFALKHGLQHFKHVIIWEYAPQSGQNHFTENFVTTLSEKITSLPSVCLILSSARKFPSTHNIIDASSLSIRENAALTHFCNLMIGCSSGITWLSTSSAGKFLPMIQLLNPGAAFLNVPSVDFTRHGIQHNGLIEMGDYDEQKIFLCVKEIVEQGFVQASAKYNQSFPLQFKTTSLIVYNLSCYLEFGAIVKHIKIMVSQYGWKKEFVAQLLKAFLGFPFKLLKNIFSKRIFK